MTGHVRKLQLCLHLPVLARLVRAAAVVAAEPAVGSSDVVSVALESAVAW